MLREIGRGWLAENTDVSTTPGKPAPQNITHTPAPAVPATAGTIPVAPTTTSRAPLEERITSVLMERPSDRAREQAPPPQERPTMHREARCEAGPSTIIWAAGPVHALAGLPNPAGKGKGKTKPQGKDDFPEGHPELSTPIEEWIQFIHQWQLHNDGMSQVFPRATRDPSQPDDSKDEAPTPFAHNIRGLLLVERLMPHMSYNIGCIGWCCTMAHLLGVTGRYHSIIEWAGMAPAVGQSVEWSGSCESSVYTLTWVATYLAANGVTYHDADDAWVWGNTHLHELC